MKDIDTLNQILRCPRCGINLVSDQNVQKLICPSCKNEVLIDGRILDFSSLTPELNLHFAEYTKELHFIAGKNSSDITDSWRIKEITALLERYNHGRTVCLEIGGGDGPLTPSLEHHFSTVISLDFSRTFLERIQSKTEKTLCICGDAHFLPIADRSIDVIVCSEVLEHVCIPTQLLLEIRRALKPNGVCILSVPNEATSGFLNSKENCIFASDSHINFFNIPAMKKLLFRMGFEILCLQKIPSPLKSLPSSVMSYLFSGRYYSHILCSLTIMKDPNIYWNKFEERLKKL
ncbi:class I SAM-dependent methyltransferase [Methanoculleus sp.]|uniref:class I SAM-dependent methyltransferase n=1 Tax=Methanoculleus sp. TaxID=90427 RepID=UPI0025F07826|nr:class I SAM-dependent methyltransferase [Methanoculleus sp.]